MSNGFLGFQHAISTFLGSASFQRRAKPSRVSVLRLYAHSMPLRGASTAISEKATLFINFEFSINFFGSQRSGFSKMFGNADSIDVFPPSAVLSVVVLGAPRLTAVFAFFSETRISAISHVPSSPVNLAVFFVQTRFCVLLQVR